MNSDMFLLFGTMTTGIFGVVLVMLIGVSIVACSQHRQRMKDLRQQCEDLAVSTREMQRHPQRLTEMDNLSEDPNLFEDRGSNSS
ncbi:hypothetical protein, conserved [Leishmania tarentolae]|uniref:Uncharacterized protein n=1 Tax=Leishmania tarentolae TaxID=5689 RepID=A0A640KGQ8_LEITA|nr:hypothetical protein, conserved [Leishmania tarentolae]